jgi:tetratricopeptide (TPR) repeat protein
MFSRACDIAVMTFLSCSIAAAASSSERLDVGKTILHVIDGGDAQRYLVHIPQDQAAIFVVDHHPMNLLVSISVSGGPALAQVDNLLEDVGRERLIFIATTTADYTITVDAPSENSPQSYEIHYEVLRKVTDLDVELVDGQSKFAEAIPLIRTSKVPSVAEGAKLMLQAFELFEKTHEAEKAALALTIIGRVFDGVHQPTEAVQVYSKSLAFWEVAGNSQFQADTLDRIAYASIAAGDRSSAIAALQSALPVWRSLRDFEGEGNTLAALVNQMKEAGDPQKAADYQVQLDSLKPVNSVNEVFALLALSDRSKIQQGIDEAQRILPLLRGDIRAQALILYGIGMGYRSLDGERYVKCRFYVVGGAGIPRAAHRAA